MDGSYQLDASAVVKLKIFTKERDVNSQTLSMPTKILKILTGLRQA